MRFIETYAFLKAVLDTVPEHIAVIDQSGEIQFVNQSWIDFGKNNSCLENNSWVGINYLVACEQAASRGDEFSRNAIQGIKKVINNEEDSYYLEYPCHSSNEKRWFMMRVMPLRMDSELVCVISHHNITERMLAEEEVLKLSRLDGLTNIANRRYFDEFLHGEWRRCDRLKLPITLALIDVDNFKMLNDAYGHLAGDECLKLIASTLKQFSKRPGDLCARYGGEEFALIFGNTDIDESLDIVNKLLDRIRALKVSIGDISSIDTITASVGLATMEPDSQLNEDALIKEADNLLYAAKEKGKDQLAYKDFQITEDRNKIENGVR